MQRTVKYKPDIIQGEKSGGTYWINCPHSCQKIGIPENCLTCVCFEKIERIDHFKIRFTCSWNGWDDYKQKVDERGGEE